MENISEKMSGKIERKKQRGGSDASGEITPESWKSEDVMRSDCHRQPFYQRGLLLLNFLNCYDENMLPAVGKVSGCLEEEAKIRYSEFPFSYVLSC